MKPDTPTYRARRATVAVAGIWRRGLSLTMALALVLTLFVPQTVLAQKRKIFLIRDAETEAWIEEMANPIFRAAGLNPKAVHVHLIGDNAINAFVAGGQRIFMNTGLILKAENPGEVRGVIAHECGHIEGAHLARMQRQLEKASTAAIIGMLVGAAAIVGGAASGEINAARVGQGIVVSNPELVRRSVLAYQRAQESSADLAAIRYLDTVGESAKGMISLFQRLADQNIASLEYRNPYLRSHPGARQRVSNIRPLAQKSAFYNKEDSPELKLKHEMIKAKLQGFLVEPVGVLRLFPQSDTSMPARYARAIAYYRSGSLQKAIAEIDHLIKWQPKNPYFWELRGQAFFENGRVREAIEPLNKAAELAPKIGLIRILLAQAMLGVEDPKYNKAAIGHLMKALRHEVQTSLLHRLLAIGYARSNELGLAQYHSAEASLLEGDAELAKQHAGRAVKNIDRKKHAQQWRKARDIMQLPNKKSK